MPVTIDGTTGIALTSSAGLTQTGNGIISFTSVIGATSGGTGLTSAGATGNVLTSTGTTWTSQAPTVTAQPGTSGNVLTSNGTAWISQTLPPASNTIASPNFTGNIFANGSSRGNISNVAALDIDCSLSNYFIKTISTDSTFTFSNVAANSSYAFTLELTHTSGAVTWPSTVRWPANTAPTLTTSKTHLFIFSTDDAGTIWRGSSLINYDS